MGTGTFVKMDVEGSEWETLEAVSDENLQKMDSLDLELHMCDGIDRGDRVEILRARVRLLERLGKFFGVTRRSPNMLKDYTGGEGYDDKFLCVAHPGLEGWYTNRMYS